MILADLHKKQMSSHYDGEPLCVCESTTYTNGSAHPNGSAHNDRSSIRNP